MNKLIFSKTAVVLSTLVLLQGCASQGPVLYPNAQYKSAGKSVVEADVRDCIALANSSGADSDRLKELAEDTARGAVIGAGTGVVSGAIFGRPAKGAAAGAAGGGTATLLYSLLDNDGPNNLHRRFVERCLRDKGYEPIG
jgi:predicted small lipoprotein YifL